MLMNVIHPEKKRADRDESEKRIRDFLQLHPIGVLATIDPDGNPHASVIYFSIRADGTLLFTTKSRTKKSDNLDLNNHVMLIIYESPTQTSVQITGLAQLVADKKVAQDSFDAMFETAAITSMYGTPPISKLDSGNYVAYRIIPSQMRMTVYMQLGRSGSDLSETIDYIF